MRSLALGLFIAIVSPSAFAIELISAAEAATAQRQQNQACLDKLLEGVPSNESRFMATHDGVVVARGNTNVAYNRKGHVDIDANPDVLACKMSRDKNTDVVFADLVRNYLANTPTRNLRIMPRQALRAKASDALAACEGPLTALSPTGLSILKSEQSTGAFPAKTPAIR